MRIGVPGSLGERFFSMGYVSQSFTQIFVGVFQAILNLVDLGNFSLIYIRERRSRGLDTVHAIGNFGSFTLRQWLHRMLSICESPDGEYTRTSLHACVHSS